MIPQQVSVIRIDDQKRILPQSVPVHLIQNFSQLLITHGKQRRIFIPCLHDFFFCLIHRSIIRPVKPLSAILTGIQLFKPVITEKRFMGVKSFNLHKPVVSVFIFLNKFHARFECPDLRMAALLLQISSVDIVLSV